MKKILLICIVSVLLTGCSKRVSQEVFDKLDSDYILLQKEYTDLLLEHEKNINVNSEIEKRYSELNADFSDLKNKLNNLLNEKNNIIYGVSHFKDIAFLMPNTWEVVKEDDIAYYYPEEGLLMVYATDLEYDTSDLRVSQHRELLDTLFDSLSSSASEYKEIGNRDVDTSISSLAKEYSYYSDYENGTYENKTFAFAYKDTLYVFVLAQPDKITDSTKYSDIISSVVSIRWITHLYLSIKDGWDALPLYNFMDYLWTEIPFMD